MGGEVFEIVVEKGALPKRQSAQLLIEPDSQSASLLNSMLIARRLIQAFDGKLSEKAK